MASVKDTNARVTRWFLALQDYRCQVDHRPGREHGNTDALSRQEAYPAAVRDDPRLHPAVKECGNLRPNPLARWPRGEVVDAVYRLYPPTPAKERTITGLYKASDCSRGGSTYCLLGGSKQYVEARDYP